MDKQLKGFKQFIADTRVDEDIVNPTRNQLISQHNAATGKGGMPPFSDLIRIEGGEEYQYVNYVQEGGGMLGVALVGYAYVLEKLGIRFLKLAGTSAGAINTMMLACTDKKNYTSVENQLNEKFTTQSEIILFEMLNYDLWQLVDGSKFGKLLISTAIKAKNNLKMVTRFLLYSLLFAIFSSLIFGILNLCCSLDNTCGSFCYGVVKILSIVAVTVVLILAGVTGITVYYLKRFSRSSFGINPGIKFHQWMTDILNRNGIKSQADLDKKMKEKCSGLSLREERLQQNIPNDNTKIDPPYLTIIASDITNQTKVEFPLMANEYWQDPAQINPADFVRASMSIPVFFEPFQIDVTQVLQEKEADTKLRAFAQSQRNTDKKIVQFVDGGILSNFPINVFHNPKIEWARMPTFGVKLEDEKHESESQKQLGKPDKTKRAFGPFLGSILSTIRFYYDRDFLKRNMIYEACIGHIDVEKFNWLDFGLDEKTKKELFLQGAKAARTFFLGSEAGGNYFVDGKEISFKAFNWPQFKEDRRKMLITG